MIRFGDGANMRSTSIPLRNLNETDEPLTRTGLTISAFNGKRNFYYTSALKPNDHHRGIQFNTEVYDEITNYHLRAIILCYRPLLMVRSLFSSREGRIVRHDAELKIVKRDELFAGTRCLIVETHSKEFDNVINRYWVDIARNGLILKHAEIVAGQTTAEMTINYKKDSLHGWVPAIWKGQLLGRSFKSVVLDFTINEPIEAGIFNMAYPAGTVVSDRDQRKSWRILEDGTKHLLTPINQ